MSPRNRISPSFTARDILLPPVTGAVLFLVTFALREGFSQPDREVLLNALCDGLTVPGIILTGLGLLRWVSDQGAFDGLSFGVRKAFGQVLREEKRNRMPKTYYDYVQSGEKNPRKSPKVLLITGLVFLAGAGIALGFYLNMG